MPNQYDRLIQENVDGLTKSLVRRILNIPNIEFVKLPRKRQRTIEREMDSLLRVVRGPGDEVVINVEWQVDNDPKMCPRMLLYHALSTLEYELPVCGVLIYIGQKAVNMQTVMQHERLKYDYTLVDLTKHNPAHLLDSDVPEEIIMAVLAGNTKYEQKREIIRKILFKLRMLLHDNSEELSRKIAQLEIIGGLRNVQNIIVEEEQKMALTFNIERDIRYNQGLEKGRQSGMQEGIEMERIAIVTNLLQNTSHSIEEIAKLVNVPLEFVNHVRDSFPQP